MTQLEQAKALIVACEADLGYELDFGQRIDLLMDNTSWDYDTITDLVTQIDKVL